MDAQLAIIREEARKRYETKRLAEEETQRRLEAEQRVVEKEERRREEEAQRILDEEEARQAEELAQIHRLFQLWDTILLAFPITKDQLEFLVDGLDEVIDSIKDHHLMEACNERVLQMIDTINLQQEEYKGTAEEVREYGRLLKGIIDRCEIDVQIDLMDTTGDVEYAERLHREMLQENMVRYDNPLPHVNLPPPLEPFALPMRLPLVSLNRRIGLTLPQIKDLAKMHRISIQGNKAEIVRRLVDAGRVRLFEG